MTPRDQWAHLLLARAEVERTRRERRIGTTSGHLPHAKAVREQYRAAMRGLDAAIEAVTE